MIDGTQRKLAAIVSADVVGYSRLMGAHAGGAEGAPKCSFHWATALSFAHYQLRNYDAALSWADQCLKLWPDHLQAIGCRAASLAQLGRLEEARTALVPFEKRFPGISASRHMRNFRWRLQKDIDHYADGLSKAGLPE